MLDENRVAIFRMQVLIGCEHPRGFDFGRQKGLEDVSLGIVVIENFGEPGGAAAGHARNENRRVRAEVQVDKSVTCQFSPVRVHSDAFFPISVTQIGVKMTSIYCNNDLIAA